ncbi:MULTISPECIES: transglutaminase-like domain-containing protein [Streptomyces]|uniref:transglutaminase-like domain-containing protein n=1 Tax=Streptomyces TaxID=1883 RepID=UPI0004CD4782|nr:transglutaminase-like domain-containing protein [Streptomyces durhamensis]
MDDFSLRHTPYSDPGDLDAAALPRDPRRLAELVRGLILHRLEGARFGYAIPGERLEHDAESRYVTEILRILRERGTGPLTEERPYDQRFVGTCRDYALLLCSLLRTTGTPARVRGGYATYFVAGFHDDHWVTEYQLPDGAWRLADPQVLHPGYGVPFDPLDVPRDRFLVAGRAWRACRAGEAGWETFGVWAVPGLRGLDPVAHSVVLDLAARTGTEPLPWDDWGPWDGHLAEDDLALLDTVAAAGTDGELRRLSTDPRLAVPRQIVSHAPFLGPRTVRLPQPSARRA